MEDPEADDCSNSSSTGPIVLDESPSSPNDSKLAGNFEKSHSKCSVCLEPTDNNHLHYGAITCFSCRAFFRRANQITKKSVYICKQENSCDISFKNRKKCQKCRFETCLKVGMDPSLVLSDEQKKTRFRKMIDKKGPNDTGNTTFISPNRSPNSAGTSVVAGNGNTSNLPNIGVPQEPKQPRVELSSSSRRTEFKLHTTETRFGGQIRRSRTVDTVSPFVSSKDGPRSRRFSGNKISTTTTSRRTDNTNFESISQHNLTPPVILTNPSSTTTTTNNSEITKNSSATTTVEEEETIFTPGVQFDIEIKQELDDVSEFDQIMAQSESCALQSDTLAELESTLNLASEMATIRSCAGASSTLATEFAYQNTGTVHRHTLQSFQSCPTPFFNESLNTSITSSHRSNNLSQERNENPASNFWSLEEEMSLKSTVSNNKISSPTIPDDILNDFSEDEDEPAEVKMIEKLLLDYKKVSASHINPEITDKIMEAHRENATKSLSIDDVKLFLRQNLDFFWQFAIRQTTFQSLNQLDQEILLSSNGSLFINYILGRYLTAPTALEQIQWIIGSDNLPSIHRENNLQNLKKIDLHEFNDQTRLLGEHLNEQMYAETILNISRIEKNTIGTGSMLGPEHCGIMAALILYHSPVFHQNQNNNMKEKNKMYNGLYDKNSVAAAFNSVLEACLTLPEYVHLAEELCSKDDFFDHLKSMREMIQGNKRLELGQHLEIPLHDEAWLKTQMRKYQNAFEEVPIGYDWIKEFVMFSYDVPLSKNFACRSYATLTERYKRILQIHEGYDNLSSKDQNDIWKEGCAKAVALCSVKSECLKTGQEQLKFIFGQLDNELWRQNFEDTLTKSQNSNGHKLKKISMVDCNRATAFLSSEELMEYMNLVVDLNELTQESEMFKLLTLVVLFSSDQDLSPNAAQFVTKIRNQYLAIVKRKLNGTNIYDKLCLGLTEVDQLSSFLKKLNLDR